MFFLGFSGAEQNVASSLYFPVIQEDFAIHRDPGMFMFLAGAMGRE